MTKALRDWIQAVTDVKRDEVAPVVLMMLYGFLAMTSYYVVKPVRNAVFVERLGAENLPYVYIATAIVVSLVMVVYSRYVDRIGHRALLVGTFAFLASNLVAFRWLLIEETFLTSGIFYIWGKLYPLLLVSQFWLVGNLLFTTRQARRLFGPIGLGLIVGGVAGSSIAGTAAQALGTENLLLLAAGILGGCAVIVIALEPHMTAAGGESGRLVGDLSGDAIRLLRRSNHLRWIATILLLTIVVTTLVDWQFNRAVELSIAGEDAKTQFFGRFFLALNVASVTVQMLFTAWVLRTWGVGVALLALPAGLLVASAGVLVVPILLTATLAKGVEGALRYSLDQSTRELLYLPVPTDVKYKVKPLIDLAVYRGGTGLGGILLLVFTNWLGLELRGVAVVAGVLIGVWVLATFRMRREFKESVKRLIGIRDVGIEDLIVERIGGDGLDVEVKRALQGGDEEEIIYSLGLLPHHEPRAFTRELTELLAHESPAVKLRSLRLLTAMEYGGAEAEARALLVDPDLGVRIAALEYVCRFGSDEPEAELRHALEADAYGVRAAAIALILRHGGPVKDDDEPAVLPVEGFGIGRGNRALAELCEEEELEARVYAARLLVEADLDSEKGRRVMKLLMDDPDAPVRHAALQAVASVGSESFFPDLIERLAEPRDRIAAQLALERVESPVLRDLLFERLADEEASLGQRLRIPEVLRANADQETADRMVDAIPGKPRQVRFEILKALDKLRRDRADLEFGGRYETEEIVRTEVTDAYLWARRCHVVTGEKREPGLLRHVLTQRMEEAAERAFRALGLEHPLEDLEAAYVALRSDDELMRQRGFELVDNALPRRHRDLFDPLLNPEKSWQERVAAAEERFGVSREGPREILETLAEEAGLCVRSLARIELGEELRVGRLTPAELRDDIGSRIRMVLDEPHTGEAIDIMDVLERADALRRTRVFRDLRGEELAGIAALLDERRYEEGDTVVPAGAGGDLHVVVRGSLAARRGGEVLYRAGVGDVFFDPSLLDGEEDDDTECVATGKTELLTMERTAFLRLLEERFAVVQGLMAHVGGMVRGVTNSAPDAEESDGGG